MLNILVSDVEGAWVLEGLGGGSDVNGDILLGVTNACL